MHYFKFPLMIEDALIAEIEGVAVLDEDRWADTWTIAAIELDVIGANDRVTLGDDHWLYVRILSWLCGTKSAEVDVTWDEYLADAPARRADAQIDAMKHEHAAA